MQTFKIVRGPSTDQGTFGTGTLIESDWSCHTGELPWKDNDHGTSCIPPGTYIAKWMNHSHLGWTYQLKDVPNRDAICIHRGNFCGSKDSGYKSDVLGCFILGSATGQLEGQQAILSSGPTIEKFEELTNKEDLQVIVE